MKRVSICAILAIFLAAGFVSAQESSGEPSADSVLQKARDKYNGTTSTQDTTGTQDTTSTQEAASTPTAAAQPNTAEGSVDSASGTEPEADSGSKDKKSEYPYSLAVIGIVPGLSFPMGIYDTNLAVASIGAINGNVFGIQASGVFASALDSIRGVQATGVFGTVENDMSGVQAGGVFNIVGGDLHGIQSAGVFNIVSGTASWIQSAGVFNLVEGNMKGVQAAGVFNLVEGSMKGLQTAGVMSVSGSFSGLMASGVVNVTGKGKGVMVSLVNIADSLDGVAIGLVNIIKDGIWDINTDYQFHSKTAYLTYRSGTPFLYAVAYAGQETSQLFSTTDMITAGIGVGHRFKFLFLSIDTELCYETSSIESYYTLGSLRDYPVSENFAWDQIAGFGSVRMSFGFGKFKGFTPYLGLKTDFGDWGKFSVPDRFRYSFGEKTVGGTAFFDKIQPFWPKWFIGIRY